MNNWYQRQQQADAARNSNPHEARSRGPARKPKAMGMPESMVDRLRVQGYSDEQIEELKSVYGSGGAPAVENVRQMLHPMNKRMM